MGLPELTSYDGVAVYVEMDRGPSITSLSRVSHIHLFGISFIFLLTGAIFAFSEIHKWVRVAVVTLPFVAMWLDILSWWVTRVQPAFAYIVILGGGLMGLCLLTQILVSLYEMWLKPAPPDPIN